jgi:hypothetical protein
VTSLRERLLGKAFINWETGCWEWAGGRNQGGYGQIQTDGGLRVVHRVSYKLLTGPIPDGLTLDHLCRVRHCLNPAHLEAVSMRVNTLRGKTVPAFNAAKTNCLHGHEYTPENTYVTPDGRRQCRACMRIRQARRYREARNRALLTAGDAS